MSFLVKSGSNNFSGNYLFAHQSGAFQGNNVTPELRAQGFDPGNNKFTRYNDISFDLGGPIIRDKLWFYGAYGYNYSGLLIPGFISIASGEQVEYFTRLDNPTLKLTYQISRNNKFEITEQLNRKWQPYRNASTFVPMEATQNQIAWTAIGPAFKFTRIMSERMTFDASFNRSGYWWPDYAWTDDVRTMDLTTTQTRGAFLELRRDPVRWGYNGTLVVVQDHRRDEPRDQVGRAGLQQHQLRRNLRLPQSADLPVSQPAGRNQLLPASRTRCRCSSTRTTPTPASSITRGLRTTA